MNEQIYTIIESLLKLRTPRPLESQTLEQYIAQEIFTLMPLFVPPGSFGPDIGSMRCGLDRGNRAIHFELPGYGKFIIEIRSIAP